MRGTVEERFWAKVDKRGPEECWLWTGAGNGTGYGAIRVAGKLLLSHRVAWALANGPIPDGLDVDHVCHSRACVNPSHLRTASRSENLYNTGKRPCNTSGFKGVFYCQNRWMAQIRANGIVHYLGRFTTPEAAHLAYCEAAKRLHGKFANTGEVK